MFEHAWMFRLQHDQEVYDEMGDKQKIRAGFWDASIVNSLFCSHFVNKTKTMLMK